MTLLQGDCLELMKAIPDGSVDMILCDPPYGTTHCKWDSVIPFEPLWGQYKRIIKENGAILLFSQQPFSAALIMSQPRLFRYEWIWEKPNALGFLNAKKMPMRAHENILCFYKRLPTYNPQMVMGKPYHRAHAPGAIYGAQREVSPTASDGSRYPRDIQKFNNADRREAFHPTQKPVALLEYLIRTYTDPGQVVLDNCMGSGSTGVACANTGRDFIGMELDPGYFEIAKKRIEEAEANAELRRSEN